MLTGDQPPTRAEMWATGVVVFSFGFFWVWGVVGFIRWAF